MLALARSDSTGARARYEEALPLSRRVGDVRGEANCIQGLGDIALRRSDYEAARARYEGALPLSRRVGDVLGEAHCIQGLGDIAVACSDLEGAPTPKRATFCSMRSAAPCLQTPQPANRPARSAAPARRADSRSGTLDGSPCG
ncbi:MAG TPA: tetratricopeptide repeat protein [Thermoanaerobaculia bacterium]|nr:tetratricopeptide repeat protein [Thermoanaerobaculia bacterium]